LNLSFNPLRGGAGSGWSIWQALLNAFACLVSIPSEVGRGRAQPSQDHEESAVQEGSSFNPLGGGAGSGSRTWPISINTKAGLFRFNPLGGGAGSGSLSPHLLPRPLVLCFVSIPSEVGRGREFEYTRHGTLTLSFVSIPSEVGRGRD